MLKFKLSSIICLLLTLIMLSACSTKATKLVVNSKKTYDFVTDTVIELDKAGLIKKADYDRIEKYADMYADLHNAAIEAVKAYKMGAMSSDEVANKITGLSMALTKLIEVAAPYVVKGD